jgi:hypothetical protein
MKYTFAYGRLRIKRICSSFCVVSSWFSVFIFLLLVCSTLDDFLLLTPWLVLFSFFILPLCAMGPCVTQSARKNANKISRTGPTRFLGQIAWPLAICEYGERNPKHQYFWRRGNENCKYNTHVAIV